jgi:hypothetical protein
LILPLVFKGLNFAKFAKKNVELKIGKKSLATNLNLISLQRVSTP